MAPEEIRRKHRDYSDLSEQECNDVYMAFIRQWPFYGSTVFDVLQGYTTTLPKNLWLAVNQNGVHILKRRDKEPLVSYEYKDIVNYRYVDRYGNILTSEDVCCKSIHLSVHLSLICLSSLCLPICLSVCLSVSLPVCLSLYVCLSTCLHIS